MTPHDFVESVEFENLLDNYRNAQTPTEKRIALVEIKKAVKSFIIRLKSEGVN